LPTGAGKATITGDFVLLASEVTPVMKALRENGIEVTAVHIHMLTENPRLFFMHFWANDDALNLLDVFVRRWIRLMWFERRKYSLLRLC
jgi:hypothetical protein